MALTKCVNGQHVPLSPQEEADTLASWQAHADASAALQVYLDWRAQEPDEEDLVHALVEAARALVSAQPVDPAHTAALDAYSAWKAAEVANPEESP